jgi:hypothetical protein
MSDSAASDAVVDAVAARGIQEVLHFTTSRGLLGILARNELLARSHVDEEPQVALIKMLNCEYRRDGDWIDHVSMSIGMINQWMFRTSSNWHGSDGIWWSVLAFDPAILGDPGVTFATTNNIYPAVRRAQGVVGFEAMFADPVAGRYGALSRRHDGMAPGTPTDPQAEVLYPRGIGLDKLTAIYVAEEERVEDVHGMLGGLNRLLDVPVRWKPEIFR